jgi:ribosomal protein S27AE
MQIIAKCPNCGFSWLLDETATDRRIRCEKCRLLFKVPKLEDIPEAAKIIKDARGTVYVDESGKTFG